MSAVHEGRSRFLAEIHRATGEITPADIGRGVVAGDAWCLTAVARAAERIGSLMAALVNFYNPDCLVFGGGAVTGGDTFLRVVDHTVRSRALPLAAADLTIRASVAGDTAGVVGGAHLAVETLLSADALAAWAPEGPPRWSRPGSSAGPEASRPATRARGCPPGRDALAFLIDGGDGVRRRRQETIDLCLPRA
ncbi:ROK family protein [Streptomyces nogalater]